MRHVQETKQGGKQDPRRVRRPDPAEMRRKLEMRYGKGEFSIECLRGDVRPKK